MAKKGEATQPENGKDAPVFEVGSKPVALPIISKRSGASSKYAAAIEKTREAVSKAQPGQWIPVEFAEIKQARSFYGVARRGLGEGFTLKQRGATVYVSRAS